ncbi:sensor histidine kinase [Lacibacter luteus]|uniref:Oxygen sensor histidine kinase NreB n=1 Tax=Lacibacter luteus TaxID=2508719 RepID=A0A4Q1CHJ7_9BACT|nr:ATP-binding protein [Lacibacter luteus]RXK59807.1 sensor histidine kinase [Lacibacter luteus]
MAEKELLILIISVTIILLLLGLFILILFVFYQKRLLINKAKLEKLQSETLKSQLEIQEHTLKNISQEIHDNVGQVLTLAKLNLATTVIDEVTSAEKIKTSQHLIGKAIQDLRDLSRSLNTDYVEEMGLLRAIEYELSLLKKTGAIETGFSINGTPVRLEKQKELILFRIVQEAIHNVIRHADASVLNTAIVFGNGQIEIAINDNGKGFNLAPLNNPDNSGFGLGIRNMHARATLIGAKFFMDSKPGTGTKLNLQLPINNITDETTPEN